MRRLWFAIIGRRDLVPIEGMLWRRSWWLGRWRHALDPAALWRLQIDLSHDDWG